MQIPLSAASISSLSPFLPRWPVAHKPLSEVTLWSGQTRLHAHIPECQKHVCWLLPHPLSARTSHLPPPVAGHGRAGTKASVSMWAEPLIWAKPQLWQRSVFLQCQFFFAARGPAACQHRQWDAGARTALFLSSLSILFTHGDHTLPAQHPCSGENLGYQLVP